MEPVCFIHCLVVKVLACGFHLDKSTQLSFQIKRDQRYKKTGGAKHLRKKPITKSNPKNYEKKESKS